ncbi:MAG: biotin/lipoyl-containing protein, partial [Solirubrobacteraceae bacterium]
MAAVNTTVQVVMPQMGESVSEGTVLEWHKGEGDTVATDETLVEISTDKVDAEVPAPEGGTIVKVHVAEGDTVTVGQLLAEISTDGAAPAAATNGGTNGAAVTEAPAADAPVEIIDIVTPAGGESVTEGTILEWAVKVGDTVADGDTVVELSTDKVDMELPAPGAGTITEILAAEGDTVVVGQVIARMAAGAASAAAPARPAPEALSL